MKIAFICFICLIFFPVAAVSGQEDPIVVRRVNLELSNLAWSPDGQRLVVAGEEGIYIFDADLQELTSVRWQTEYALSISWKPDGSQFATGDSSRAIRIWNYDVKTDAVSLERIIPTDYSWVSVVRWSPDGNKLAVLKEIVDPSIYGVGGQVEIWNTQTWSLESTSIDHYSSPTRSLSWSADSLELAVGGQRGCHDEAAECRGRRGGVFILDVSSGEAIEIIETNAVPKVIAWTSTGEVIFAQDGIYAFDDTKWNILRQNSYLFTPVLWTTNPDGNLFAADAVYSSLAIYRIDTLEPLQPLQSTSALFPSASRPFKIAWSPQDNRIATISLDGLIQIWDVSKPDDRQ